MQRERKCKVCGEKFFHNSKVRCRKCRVKRVKISPSWEDGIKVIEAGTNNRDRLAMRLCLYPALREGELLGSADPRHGNLKPLTKKQIDFDNKKIVIYGKGGTVEYVFLDNKTIVMIKNYLKNRRVGLDRPLINLGTRQFQRIVKQAAHKAGVENAERYGPHILRAISITRMCSVKGLSRARYHARHSSERTTIIYDRPTLDERREDFDTVFTDDKN